MKYDLGFGDPIVVRQALCMYMPEKMLITEDFLKLGYGNKSGNPSFLSAIKKVIKEFTGKEYKHNFITNGATGGINVVLRAIRDTVTNYDSRIFGTSSMPRLFYERPAFHYYNDMASYSGYLPVVNPNYAKVLLIDSPRNPTGHLYVNIDAGSGLSESDRKYIIWDSAYHSPIYNKKTMNLMPPHTILVGSFGKTTGLTGLRLGWVSTDDDGIAKKIEKSLHAENLGISQHSQATAAFILGLVPMDKFYKTAANMIDDNRDMFSKLNHLFNLQVPETGMFYYAPISGYLEKVLGEMGVNFIRGTDLEGIAGWGRFSLAQDRDVIKNFTKEILRRDG